MKDRTTLVFLSGWASSQGVWFNQEEYFSSYRINHIDYHRNVESFSVTACGMSSYGENALKMIKEESNPVVLVGWSLGAMVAMELALFAPEKIQGMVLVDGTARFINEKEKEAGIPGVVVDRMKKKLIRNTALTLEDFYTLMFTEEEREVGFLEKFQQQILASGVNWSRLELQVGLDYLKNRNLQIQLRDVKVPTLIIHGERDEICPIKAGQNFYNNIEGSLFKSLPDCGHLPFISRARDFNKELERWIYGIY